MTKAHKPDSQPPPPVDQSAKKDKNKNDGTDQASQGDLDEAIASFSIMLLQKIMADGKERRAEMNEDDPDKF